MDEIEDGEVEAGAAVLLADDERTGMVEADLGWAQGIIAKGKAAEHSGDCTDEAHTCIACQREIYMGRARAVLEASRKWRQEHVYLVPHPTKRAVNLVEKTGRIVGERLLEYSPLVYADPDPGDCSP